MSNTLLDACVEIFRESFEGVKPGNQYTWYVEGKEAIFDALSSISAEQASRQIPGARATIGAHANHLCYYLHLFNVGAHGGSETADWEGSWTKQTFNEAEWQDVAERTHREFDEVYGWHKAQVAEGREFATEDEAIHVISNIAHAAYHLGAMRALIPQVQ